MDGHGLCLVQCNRSKFAGLLQMCERHALRRERTVWGFCSDESEQKETR
jgi:hypothetical protein